MKVIFLDIDGVLNSRSSAKALGGYPHKLSQMSKFDKVALGLIRKLVKQTGAKVVISSTWRSTFTTEEFSKAFKVPVIGKTVNSAHGHRGEEIAEYLSANPEVTDYVIIDDDIDMLEEQFKNFVRTNYLVGFTLFNYVKACRILGSPDEELENHLKSWEIFSTKDHL